jgi:short subunit dehydrogenase-like uncharacterized protein
VIARLTRVPTVSRIVLFGATGYTGRLTAHALVTRGARPVLAARSEAKLRDLVAELGGDLETQTADVARPESVGALVERGDVLVSTVGPFTRWGDPAVQGAIAAGAHYLDSTGETPFIRRVFERFGGAAESAGCGLVTAFGYDWVPGNLAGALALREAGPDAVRVDIGYFITGAAGMSGGTRASAIEALVEPSYAWRDRRLVTEPAARRMRHFDVEGRSRAAISVGTSEAFALPRIHRELRDVGVYLGWFGGAARPMTVMSSGLDLWRRVPVLGTLHRDVLRRVVKGSSGGPDAAARKRSGSYVVAAAYGANGAQLAEVPLTGVNGYDFTGRMLAWGAEQALAGGLQGTGALGPVDGFGLDALQAGAAEAGIARP